MLRRARERRNSRRRMDLRRKCYEAFAERLPSHSSIRIAPDLAQKRGLCACGGVRARAPQVRLDRRGRHRRAASVARFTPRMCGVCAGERRNFDSIGLGITGAPRPGPFQATDGRGVRGGAQQIRLDRRGRHRHAGPRICRGVCGGAPQVRLDRRGRHRRAASVARFTPRMCGACAGEHRKFDSISVGVTGAPRDVATIGRACVQA
jgi:hypothetical protein